MARTRIDSSICSGNQLCADACPEVYEIVDGYGEVRAGMEEVPAELLPTVRDAVAACPEGAVILEE